jgi:hypothetical protein
MNSDVLEWSVVPSSLYSGSMLFNVTFNNNSVISCPSLQEEFEDTKGVIRIRISKTNRQHNDQKKKYKRTNNDLEKHTHKTKDRVTRTPLKTGGEPRWSGRVGSSCSTNGTHRVNLVTNSVIIRESGKYREVFTTSGTYPLSFVTYIFHIGQPRNGDDRKIFEVTSSTTLLLLVDHIYLHELLYILLWSPRDHSR